MEQLKVLSLFSGCGGMDLGFEGNFKVHRKAINTLIHPDWIENNSLEDEWVMLPKTGFKTIFANDILPSTKASWVPFFTQRNNKKEDFILDSIVSLVKNHKSNQNIFPGVDVVAGGFPCQDFSVAGLRKGFSSHKAHHGGLLTELDSATEENRGKLYMWMKEVIEIVKPKVFIAENVKGLMSLSNVKSIIENDFKSINSGGYLVVEAKVLYAPNYGIPQTRERVIFFGFNKNELNKSAIDNLSKKSIPKEYDPYPLITHAPDNSIFTSLDLLPYVKTRDVLLDLAEPCDSMDPSQIAYSKAKYYGNHVQGHTEIDLDGLSPTIRAEHHGNIEFRRLSLEHNGRYVDELNFGLKERRLTVRECARLQTFPDDYVFVRDQNKLGKEYSVSASNAYKLIGNAVPPLLAFNIAWRVQELWPKLFS